MIRLATLLLAFAVSTAAAQDAKPAAPADPFAAVRFMVGTWKGESNGQPGAGTSERAYAFEFGETFLAVRNTTVYAPRPKSDTGEVHHDAGFFSYDKSRKRLVFRQRHGEGFVNQYVEDPAAGTAERVVFVTESIENIPSGWRARETYRRTGPDTMTEVFELAAPGKPFSVYSEARLTRVAGDDRAQVLAVAQKLFDGIAARDGAVMSSVLLKGGQVHSTRDENGQQTVRSVAFDEFVRSAAASQARLLERMWDADVRVFGRIATVAAPYDFHRDGVFSHCGTDVFDLVKTPEGWKISGILYTVERQGCRPSPLGPPR